MGNQNNISTDLISTGSFADRLFPCDHEQGKAIIANDILLVLSRGASSNEFPEFLAGDVEWC